MSIIDTNVLSLNKATFFTSFLTLDNDNDSSNNYSSGVTEFSYTHTDPDSTLFISDLVINVRDDGPFNLEQYGGSQNELINGINIYYTSSNGSIRNNIVGTTFNIKKNADFYNYTTDIKLLNNNTSESIFTTNLNFQKNYSNIRLGVTDKISFELNDDFSDISEQTVSINGFSYPNSNLL